MDKDFPDKNKRPITIGIAFKLSLSTFLIGLLICSSLAAYFFHETQNKIKIQAHVELSQITNNLKLALETNSHLSNMIRIVGVLATQENIARLSVIKSSSMRISADSLAQYNGKLASEVFPDQIMSLLLSSQHINLQQSGQFIGSYLQQAIQFPLIDPQVNRLRPYIIYLKYDKTVLEATIKKSRDTYLLIVISGFILLLLINLWIQKIVILTPLSKMANQLKNQSGNEAIPQPLITFAQDEFCILANSYNQSIHKQLLQKQELEKSHRHINNMTKILPIHLAYIDTEQKIQFMNHHSLNWLNCDIIAVLGHDLQNIIPINLFNIMQPYIDQALNGEPLTFDAEFTHNNQAVLFFHITQVPDIDVDNKINGCFICIEDQTQTRNNEKKINKYAQDLEMNNWALDDAREKAEATAKAKSEFLACMSHEIRTPMNGVLGMLTLISRTTLEKNQRHHLEMAQGSAKSLLKIINDILDFSKIESGKLHIESIEFNLQQALDELIQPLAIRAQGKNLEFILDATRIKPAEVIGDPGRITQVLTNLIGNAIKFTQQGCITVIGKIISEHNQHRLIFSIQDTGIGMKKEKFENIFQPFSQADSSTTRHYGGTGLGLSIARNLSQLMGGGISVTSTEDEGSHFNVDINIQLPNLTSALQAPSLIDLDTLPILILSNNSFADNILESMLKAFNASVTKLVMVNDTDPLDLSDLINQQPKLVILSLPIGESFIKAKVDQLNNQPLLSQLPTLLHYHSIDATTINQYLKNQIYGAITKPISQIKLIEQLKIYNQDQSSPSNHHVSDGPNDWLLKDHFGDAQPKLLLVEDNMVNQLVAKGIINEFGLEIDIADDGLQALDILSNSHSAAPYHLIFMDCQMPKLDGYQTTEKIRTGEAGEIYKTVPIVAMTANAMVGDKEKCIAAGMDDYISKPLDPECIKKALLTSLVHMIKSDK
ncbi:response regulator [Shewanella sp. VB17]|uniref:ATP-binding protein n=1 Tax=Shewanella sp. VB17 TaxID=2739432 RepID=UPI0015638142|nr:ATP-binding protein [Shewanella sp. VB17]NRD71679.1 response regulator [Shewanella sp. VB17]